MRNFLCFSCYNLRRVHTYLVLCSVFGFFLLAFFLISNEYTGTEQVKTAIVKAIHQNKRVAVETPTVQPINQMDRSDFPCVDTEAQKFGRVEDIFCLKVPEFDMNLKNPCFYNYDKNNKPILRCLPYFMVIGMDKSGSSDLHSRIVEHPYIFNNTGKLGKETNFWAWWRYGLHNKRRRKISYFHEYPNFFWLTAQNITKTHNAQLITGDATPMDLWDHRSWPLIPQNNGGNVSEPRVLTPHLIKYIFGDRPPKFIIQLREPIERLFSDYVFLHYGKTGDQFHKHVQMAISMMEACIKQHNRRWCFYDKDLYQKLPARIHLSCYSIFIKEWLNVFPRSQFHITRTTDYANDTKGVLTSVFDFLDTEPMSEATMQRVVGKDRKYVTKAKKNKSILPKTKDLLRKYYADCNAETAQILQDDRYLWEDHYKGDQNVEGAD